MQEQRVKTRKNIVERMSRAQLSAQDDAVRKAILTAFAEEGKAPSMQALAHTLNLPFTSVLQACRILAAADLIVWQDDTTRILSAYPFSGVPTAHEVLLAGHTPRYAMCALDALGIPCMLGQGSHIQSVCFFCHTPVAVDIDGDQLQRVHPSTLVVWLSAREDGCCVAEARCPLMNFFCDESHVHAWHASCPQESGTSVSAQEAFEVGKAAFGALLT